MNIKGVFFDLYGTLLIYGDMNAAWSDWLSGLYENLCHHGLSVSKQSLTLRCDAFFSKKEPPLNNDGLTIFERRIASLCADLNMSLENETVSQIAADIANAWQEYVALDPEAISVLKKLSSDKSLALISNFDHPPHIYCALSKLGIDKFFNAVVISGDVGVKKPDPAIFSVALDKTRLNSDEVIYVGDTDEDIIGARLAGITPILIRRETRTVDNSAFDFRSNKQNAEDLSGNDLGHNVTVISGLSEIPDVILRQAELKNWSEET
jgi:putative hydrolase of the HAD superfamily